MSSITEVMRLADEYAKAYHTKNSKETGALHWFFAPDHDKKRDELSKAVEELARNPK